MTSSGDEYILSQVAKMVEELNKTLGTNQKIEKLQEYKHLQHVLRRVFDDHLKTGITPAGFASWQKKGSPGTAREGLGLLETFDALAKAELSGNAARATVESLMEKHKAHASTVLAILAKDLRIRMSAKTLNKAFPDMFKEFNVMLAHDFTPEDFKKNMLEMKNLKREPQAYLSQKIDGVRLLTNVTAEGVKHYSRAGNEFTALGNLSGDFAYIAGEVKAGRMPPQQVDGEVIALDSDGKQNFKLTVSFARKKNETMEHPYYKMFDIIPLECVEGKGVSAVFSERLATLKSVMAKSDAKFSTVLEQTPWSEEAERKLQAEAKDKGWEGIMYRFNVPWSGTRSKYLLKWKLTNTSEFRVESVVIEDMVIPDTSGGERKERMLRNVIIKYKNGDVSVGSGFDRAERIQFAADPKLIEGKTIIVRYQEPFLDKDTGKWSLRCPIYMGLVGNGRDF